MNSVMTENQRFDALLALGEYHRDRLEQRRSYRWKIDLALWAGLGLLAGQMAINGIRLDPSGRWSRYAAQMVLLVVGVLYVLWTLSTERRNSDDRELAKRFCDKAERLPNPRYGTSEDIDPTLRQAVQPRRRLWRAFWRHRVWGSVTQIGFTVCMLALVWLALSGGFKPVAGNGVPGHEEQECLDKQCVIPDVTAMENSNGRRIGND